MIIDVLVCRPDGTQTMEQREVPDNWNEVVEPEPLPDYNAFLQGLMEGYINEN